MNNGNSNGFLRAYCPGCREMRSFDPHGALLTHASYARNLSPPIEPPAVVVDVTLMECQHGTRIVVSERSMV